MLDLRRKRAEALAAALMQEIDDVLGDYDRGPVYDRLRHVLYMNGAAWTTDEDRAAHGLEPRDELGWTPSERVKHEQQRIEMLYSIAALPTIEPKDQS